MAELPRLKSVSDTTNEDGATSLPRLSLPPIDPIPVAPAQTADEPAQATRQAPVAKPSPAASRGTGKVPYQSTFEAAARRHQVPVNVLMGMTEKDTGFKLNDESAARTIDSYGRTLRANMDGGLDIHQAIAAAKVGKDFAQDADAKAYSAEVVRLAREKYGPLYGRPAPKAATPAPAAPAQASLLDMYDDRSAQEKQMAQNMDLRRNPADAMGESWQKNLQQAGLDDATVKAKAQEIANTQGFRAASEYEAEVEGRRNQLAAEKGAPIEGIAKADTAQRRADMRRDGILRQVGADTRRGFQNLSNLGTGISALASDVAGFDEQADTKMREFVLETDRIARENPAAVGSWKNIHGFGDAGRYATEAVFENLAMFLPSLVTGGIGAIGARKASERAVAGMIESQVAAGASRAEAERLAAAYVQRQVMKASAAGAAPASIGMESSSIYGDIYAETGERHAGIALGAGTVAGLLDTVEPVLALRKMIGPELTDTVASHIIKRLGKEAGLQFITESGTEGLQTIIENAAVRGASGKAVVHPETLDGVLDAMLKGGIAGGAMGTVSQGWQEARGGALGDLSREFDRTMASDGFDADAAARSALSPSRGIAAPEQAPLQLPETGPIARAANTGLRDSPSVVARAASAAGIASRGGLAGDVVDQSDLDARLDQAVQSGQASQIDTEGNAATVTPVTGGSDAGIYDDRAGGAAAAAPVAAGGEVAGAPAVAGAGGRGPDAEGAGGRAQAGVPDAAGAADADAALSEKAPRAAWDDGNGGLNRPTRAAHPEAFSAYAETTNRADDARDAAVSQADDAFNKAEEDIRRQAEQEIRASGAIGQGALAIRNSDKYREARTVAQAERDRAKAKAQDDFNKAEREARAGFWKAAAGYSPEQKPKPEKKGTHLERQSTDSVFNEQLADAGFKGPAAELFAAGYEDAKEGVFDHSIAVHNPADNRFDPYRSGHAAYTTTVTNKVRVSQELPEGVTPREPRRPERLQQQEPQAAAPEQAQQDATTEQEDDAESTPAELEAMRAENREKAKAYIRLRAKEGKNLAQHGGGIWGGASFNTGAPLVKKGEVMVDFRGRSHFNIKELEKEIAEEDKASAASTSTAPEHAAVGVDDRELSEIVEQFNAAQAAMQTGDDQFHHIFDDPKPNEVVKLQDKVKVYTKEHGWMTPEEARQKVAEWKKHALEQGDTHENSDKVVLSFFDLTGKWSQPWEDAGYQVFRFDIQADPDMGDVNNFSVEFFNDWFGSFDGMEIHAILAACPCTDFASSGARHFAAKDADGRTVASVNLVHQTLRAIEYFRPAVWAIENPVGRIEKLGGLPPWRLSFDPNHLGETYTKKTLIWGRFNADLPIAPVEPVEGSKMHRKYGGKSIATKNARSATPEGFAYGFFMANNAVDHPEMALANTYDRLDPALFKSALEAGLSKEDIKDAIDDYYYQELDDKAAENALREAIEEAGGTPPGAGPQGGKGKGKKPGKKAPPASERPINPVQDDLLAAIAKAGGLSTAEARAQGIDPAEFNRRGAGIRRIFTKGGASFDQMAENLHQFGYPVADERGYSANALLDRVLTALSGKRVLTPDGERAQAEADHALRAAAEGDMAPIEALAPETEVDATPVERYLADRLLSLQDDAAEAGTPREWVEWALEQHADNPKAALELIESLVTPFTQEDFNHVRNAEAATGRTRNQGSSWLDEDTAGEGAGGNAGSGAQAEDFALTPQTEAEIQQKEAREQDEQAAEEAARQRQIDATRDAFTLSTGTATAGQQLPPAVRGPGGDLFATPRQPAPAAAAPEEAQGRRKGDQQAEAVQTYERLIRKMQADGQDIPADLVKQIRTDERLQAADAEALQELAGVEVLRRGAEGMKLEAGEVVLTATGRETTPFPRLDFSTDRKSMGTQKRVDQWLMDNAIAEAEARRDSFNARQFRANRDKPSQADKDSAELYLFDRESVQPERRSLLKPLVSKNTIVTDDAAEKARAVIRSRLNRTSVNPMTDPELMQAGLTLTIYHLEKGARTFAAYAEAMVADMTEEVRPFLKSWYLAAKYNPLTSAMRDEMSTEAEVNSDEGVPYPETTDMGYLPWVERYRQESVNDMVSEGIDRKTAERLSKKPRYAAPMDAVTGLIEGRRESADGVMDAQVAVDKAVDYVDQTNGNAFWVSADIANLGGLNAHMNNVQAAANVHYRAVAQIFKSELEALGATIDGFRTGGDEFGAVVIGSDPEAVRAVTARIRTKVYAYRDEHGLADFPHPKSKPEAPKPPGLGIHLGYTQIVPGTTGAEAMRLADLEMDKSKNEAEKNVAGIEAGAGGSPVRNQGPAGDRGEGPGAAGEGGGLAAGAESPAAPQPEQVNAERAPGRAEQAGADDALAGAQSDLLGDQREEGGRGNAGAGTEGNGQPQPDRAAGVPAGDAAAAGERGNQQADLRSTGIVPAAPRNADGGGSGVPSTGGLFADRAADGATDAAAAKAAAVTPPAAPAKIPTGALTVAAVKAAMPFLTDGQAEDVVFAQKRLSKPDGYGVLFTNGTGTGKTFTGLAIAKTAVANGAKNILIAVPKQTIADSWKRAGQSFFGLEVKSLKDTKDNGGGGIVVTTYANIQDNPSLAQIEWDMFIPDEAHTLSQGQEGAATQALQNIRALAKKEGSSYQLAKLQNPELWERIQVLNTALEAEYKRSGDFDGANTGANVQAMEEEHAQLVRKLRAIEDGLEEKRKAIKPEDKPRAVFLSATPFSYEKSVKWAQEWLFDWGNDADSSAYNSGNNFERFMMQHFGYRMRYNKLTAPDAKVDSGLMQRAFNAWLKSNGALSGRTLDSDFDYDRRFVMADSAIGRRVDEAISWLNERSAGTKSIMGMDGVANRIIRGNFDYHARMYFLEAIKAKEAMDHIRGHLALGRKVLVMHDFKKGGASNPFIANFEPGSDEAIAYREFANAFKDLIEAFEYLPSPIEQLTAAFPEALVYNGDVSAKKRVQMQDAFNSDAPDSPKLMVAQGDAMREGVSVHDTTGKHQRVIVHLGMPTKPTAAIQQEGRIYRTGQASNAMFRYFSIGSAWERGAFASTIARRAGAAENLAMGELARGLKDAFITAYEDADSFPPGFEGEGTGGKSADKQMANNLTPWDMAKSFYFGTKKQGKGRSSAGREGVDYFATPEPVGLKMVQWADIRGGEDVLEPSAGHGAIARWFPENAKIRAIEPSTELATRMALRVDGDIVVDSFENHNTVNKYDAIVMNPPYGQGGKTAIEHLAKAARHLREGGRIVALIPTGPSADKHFDKWFYGTEERAVSPLVENHRLGALYRGDVFKTRVSWMPEAKLVRRDKQGVLWFKGEGRAGETVLMPDALGELMEQGPRKEQYKPADGLFMVRSVKLPGVTFERAGTSVATRIVVIEKPAQEYADFMPQLAESDLSAAESIDELFERLQFMETPARKKPVEDTDTVENPMVPQAPEARPTPAGQAVRSEELGSAPAPHYTSDLPLVEHTTGSGKLLKGVIAPRSDFPTREAAQTIDRYTFPKDGGWFIRAKHVVRPQGGQVNEVTGAYRAEEPRPRRSKKAKPDDQAQLDLLSVAADTNPATLREQAMANFTVQARTEEMRTVNVAFDHIRNADEASQVFLPFRDRAQETFLVALLDGNGKVIEVSQHSIGQIDAATVTPSVVVGVAASNPAVKSVWVAHNHPSGMPKPSSADQFLTRKLSELLLAINIPMEGHIILGRDTYSRLNERGDEVGSDTAYSPAQPRTKVSVTERVLAVRKDPLGLVGSPTQSKAFARQFDADGIMLMDTQHRLLGFLPVSNDEKKALRANGGAVARQIAAALERTNARATIAVSKVDDRQASENLGNFLGNLDIRHLDNIVLNPNGTTVSYAERGGPIGDPQGGFLRRDTMPTADELAEIFYVNAAEGSMGTGQNLPLLFAREFMANHGMKTREEQQLVRDLAADPAAMQALRELLDDTSGNGQTLRRFTAEIQRVMDQGSARRAEAADGDAYFDPDKLEAARNRNDKSRDILVYMSPDEFLRLAQKRSAPDSDKQATVQELGAAGTKFDAIPFLDMDVGGFSATVTGHEGRHRADFLKARGVKMMPVVINTNRVRWGQQDNPRNTFDYMETWPQELTSENGETFQFPMAQASYQLDPTERWHLAAKDESTLLRDIMAELGVARRGESQATPLGNRHTKASAEVEIRKAGFGWLLDNGGIVVHANGESLPGNFTHKSGITGFAWRDGSIHVNAAALNARNKLMPVLLHEAFHARVRPLIGTEKWNGLMRDLGKLYRQAKASKGALNEHLRTALAKVERATEIDDLSEAHQIEEFGAYALDAYDAAPRTLRLWVDDLLGAVKAWVLQAFGKQLGQVTPAQLRQLAKAALRDRREGPTNGGTRAARNDTSAKWYFSPLAKAVEGMKQETAPASQWKATIAKLPGVKPDEIQWTGLNEWLDLHTGKVQRADILDFLNRNGVQVRDVMLGGSAAQNTIHSAFEQAGYRVEYGADGADFYDANDDYVEFDELPPELQEVINQNAGDIDEARITQYHNYTLPGGKEYRELLLTFPGIQQRETSPGHYDTEAGARIGTTDPRSDQARYYVVDSRGEWSEKSWGSREEAEQELARLQKAHPGITNEYETERYGYSSSHWSEDDIAVHVRFNTRTDADGKRVLFIEEIQSDWGQTVKKKGSFDPAKPFAVFDTSSGKTVANFSSKREAAMDAVARGNQFDYIDERNGGGKAPIAPFVGKTDAWVALAIKRMVRYAAENGFDRMAFVSGQQSADRYDLSKQISKIGYYKNDGRFKGEPAGTYNIYAENLSGKSVFNKASIAPDELDGIVGKEMANKILSDEGEPGANGFKVFSGIDLKVGGEGMIAFYDKIVPTVAKDVLKKLGGGSIINVEFAENEPKQEDGQLVYEERLYGNHSQLGFDITDDLRDKALQGLPLFRRGDDDLAAGTPENRFEVPPETRGEKLQRWFQDRFNRVLKTQRAVQAQGGKVVEAADVYKAEERYHGRVTARTEDFMEQEIKPFIEAVAKANVTLDEVAEYAYAEHAKERNDYIARINERFEGTDNGSGMTGAEADEILAKAARDRKADTLAALTQQLRDMAAGTRRLIVDEGLESAATVQAWEGMFQKYVPLKGFEKVDELGQEQQRPTGIGKGFSVRGRETKAATGRESRASLIIENIVEQRERVLKRAEKNRVAKSLLRLVLDNPDPALWAVNEVTHKPVVTGDTPVITDIFSGNPTHEPRTDGRKVKYVPVRNRYGDDVVVAKVKGRETLISIKDPILAEQLQMRDAKELPPGFSHFNTVHRALARMWTSLNPVFTVTNYSRDIQTAMINALGEAGGKVATKTAKYALPGGWAMKAIYQGMTGKDTEGARWYHEYRAAGGKTGFMVFDELEDKTRKLESLLREARGDRNKLLAAGAKVIEALEGANSIIENAARLGAYRAAIEEGMTRAQAVSLAKNLTVNFNRRGEWTHMMGSLYLFFNPAVQGTARILQALKSRKVQTAVAMLVLGSAGLAAFNAMLGGDDEDGEAYYNKIPASVKDRNLIIMAPWLGAGMYHKIPMPYGYAFFASVGNALYEMGRGAQSGAKTTMDLLLAAANNFNPIDTGTPTLFTPFLQIEANRDHFGRRIMPEQSPYELKKPDSQLYFPSMEGSLIERGTTWLNEATGGNDVRPGSLLGVVDASVSPESVEHLLKFVTGGLGTAAMDVVKLSTQDDREWTTLPFVKQVVGAPFKGQAVNTLYERSAELDLLDAEADFLRSSGQDDKAEALEAEHGWQLDLAQDAKLARADLSRLRKEQRAIEADAGIPAEERRAAVRELRAEMDRVAIDFNKTYNTAKKGGNQ